MQGGHSERGGKQRADEEEPQAGGEPEVLHLVGNIITNIIIIVKLREREGQRVDLGR